MLKGSLQTVALPEVLNFLADTGKTGEFHLSGSHGGGRLWFDQGRISGLEVTRAQEPSEAIFELLRVEDGEFDFASDSERSEHAVVVEADAGAVAPALELAEAKLAEWRDIVAVVPSLEHGLQLRAETPAEAVTLEPEQWMMVVAIGAGRSVAEVIDARGMQEFDGCKAVRDLVEASLVEVVEPAVNEVHEGVAESTADFGFEAAGYADTAFVDMTEPAGVDYSFEPVGEGETYEAAAETPVEVHHTDEAQEGDHYAALRAAMVEIGEDLVAGEDAPVDEPAAHTYEFETEPGTDSRAALQALLSEVTAEGAQEPVTAYDDGVAGVAYDDHVDPLDGLADRGPWTQHELTAMDTEQGWQESPDESSNIVPFAPVHAEAEAGQVATYAADVDSDAGEETAPTEEPINRGLLLKFLSSVRN